jgi:hypothetical protein
LKKISLDHQAGLDTEAELQLAELWISLDDVDLEAGKRSSCSKGDTVSNPQHAHVNLCKLTNSELVTSFKHYFTFRLVLYCYT